jgi:hypothetical protein
MSKIDTELEMKLLRGKKAKPLLINDIPIEPITLAEIEEVGYNQYNLYLFNLVRDIEEIGIDVDLSGYVYWDIILHNMLYGREDVQQLYIESFEFFLKNKVTFNEEKLCFLIDDKVINQDFFNEFVLILKIQNCVSEKKDNDMKTANKKAEEIKRKILEGRKRLEKNSQITINDLISVLCANGDNGIDLFNVWDLTYYQFDNQFYRMKMIDDYRINIRQLIAGAKPSELDLKHYLSPITNK